MNCPKCNTKVSSHPIKNQDGSWNWKNLLIGNPIYIWITIFILLMVFGMRGIKEDYYNIIENPYEFCEEYTFRPVTNPNDVFDDSDFEVINMNDINFTTT